MKRIAQHSLLLSLILILSSCGNNSQLKLDRHNEAHEEAAGHYLQAQRDYCSSNIFVAERGLAEYRQWLSDSNHPCEPWFNRNENLFQVDARLFLVKETLGETNIAEVLYREAAKAYTKFLYDQHLPEHVLSKEELRQRLALQEKGLDVRWEKVNDDK